MPDFLSQAVEKIRGIHDLSLKKSYANALKDSLTFDTSPNPHPNPLSPDQISEKYGISNDDQEEFMIVLKKRNIKDFVYQYGKKLKVRELNNNFKSEAYQSKFHRDVSRMGQNTSRSPMIYTYAEILQCLNFNQIDIPQSLKSLLEELQHI